MIAWTDVVTMDPGPTSGVADADVGACSTYSRGSYPPPTTQISKVQNRRSAYKIIYLG